MHGLNRWFTWRSRRIPASRRQSLANTFPAPPGSAGIAKTADGDLYLPTEAVRKDFAPDVKPAEQLTIAATQGPIKADAFGEKVTHAAWHNKPSWYVVSENDRMINPALERAMAKTIHAKTTGVAASHVSMVSPARGHRPND